MDPLNLVTTFWNLFSEQKWDEAMALLHDELVVFWPQSREKMTGPQNFVDVNRYYPGNHKIRILRSHQIEEEVLTTVWIEADTGQKVFANSFFSFKDDRIIRIEEYWSDPYPAPEWRKQWVEEY